MLSETSRVATLVGFVGLVLGAVLGAAVDNYLERDRNLEKSVYEKQADAIVRMMGGSDTTPLEKINYGRKLIALTGNPETVRAVKTWMKWEDRTLKNVDTCRGRDERIEVFHRMRLSMRAASQRSWSWLPWARSSDELSADVVWEVFNRCLFKN